MQSSDIEIIVTLEIVQNITSQNKTAQPQTMSVSNSVWTNQQFFKIKNKVPPTL